MAGRPDFQTMLEALTGRGVEFSKPPSAANVARIFGVALKFPSLQGTQLRQAGRGHAFTPEHPGRASTAAARAPEVFAPVKAARELRLPSFVKDVGNRVFTTEGGRINSKQRMVRTLDVLKESNRPRDNYARADSEPRVIITVRTKDGRTVTIGGKGGIRTSVLNDLMAESRTRREFLGKLRAMQYGHKLPSKEPGEEGDEEEEDFAKEYGAELDLDSVEFTQY